MTAVVLLLVAGGFAGSLAIVFGVDVGIILVPVLILAYRNSEVSSLVSTHLAVGTSLLVTVVGSLMAGFQLMRNGHALWKAVIFVSAAGVVGAAIGSWVAGELAAKTLQAVFALVLGVVAIRLLFERQKPRGDAPPRVVAASLSGLGFAAGLIASLTGTGRDTFLAPVLYNTTKFPLKKATGTSCAALLGIALAGTLGYAIKGWGHAFLPDGAIGYVDYVRAIPIIIGMIVGTISGDLLLRKTHVVKLKKGFAALLIVIAAEMILL